jgi:outer membrane protein assembly factor BamB
MRPTCNYGVMPCNGLLYAPPHACACYVAAKLVGFNALSAARSESATPDSTAGSAAKERLEMGPAFADAAKSASETPDGERLDWPTYRSDAGRSGVARSPVTGSLQTRWCVHAGGKPCALTVGNGKVFTALPNQHCIMALDADSGRPEWSFTAAARVDSPPKLHKEDVLFRSCDGYVYHLRSSDGRLG